VVIRRGATIVEFHGTDTHSECGDGLVTGHEQCDGENFMVLSCQVYGFSGGQLLCEQNCEVETDACIP